MLILGIETSTPRASVCLAAETGLVASAALSTDLTRGRGHNEFVADAVSRCLTTAGLRAEDVTGVAAGLGPGRYTGMRVGIATAAAFAHARGLPAVGIASLDLLAFSVRHARREVYAAIDVRRGEVAWARYRPAPGGVQRVADFHLGTPDALASEVLAMDGDVLCVGDGALLARGELEAVRAEVGTDSSAYPTAHALAELAVQRYFREEFARPEELTPVYLRATDARIGWATRGGLRGGGP